MQESQEEKRAKVEKEDKGTSKIMLVLEKYFTKLKHVSHECGLRDEQLANICNILVDGHLSKNNICSVINI